MRDPIRAVLLDIDGGCSHPWRPGGTRCAQKARHPVPVHLQFHPEMQGSNRRAIFRHGIFVPEEQILTPAVAAASLLSERKIKGRFLLTTGDVARDFTEAGIRMREKTADAVVVG
jgi:ribonucleotide monophosphatase NagD (HAD superfamily)